ncbi:MAG: D-2-hydroxyacid dehydrogenase [Chloroflexi bacterium]|nr:MAG: D-2-hydroxyacid dehydrogenase [Chloroflexota bacterium]MBL1197096.1 D-2-hydroxyacid dehydrogenase [Chloroflexota bacterium]NOH14391.1 D-2-hydroxyacid dehydrogenase [Chloroflexota bacterium]
MSEKRQLLVTIELSAEQLQNLQEAAPQFEIVLQPALQAEEILPEVWRETEILYTWNVLPSKEQTPNLRWVQLQSAGVDKQLEHPLFENEDLIVTSMSGANAPQVAEHALALMLALGHKIPTMFGHQSRSDWPTNRTRLFSPAELRDSTVGIVGYGSLGRELARLLGGFNVEVLASKANAMQTAEAGYTPEGTGDPDGELPRRIYPGEALRSMFKECDFVVVTVPLTDKTRGMIGAEQLAALKPEAYIIDVSRGGVIDHQALIEILQSNQIAGAALDVFPQEPLPADSLLWELPNVIVSPHVAGISKHYTDRALDLVKENLHRYLNEEPLLNQVEHSKGY